MRGKLPKSHKAVEISDLRLSDDSGARGIPPLYNPNPARKAAGGQLRGRERGD